MPSFDLTYPTSDHHNESKLLRITLSLDDLKREQASSLHTRSQQNLKSSLDAAILFNEKSTDQSFSRVDTSAGVMKTLRNDMVFWYVYLHSKDVDRSTGVIHIHVIYYVVNA